MEAPEGRLLALGRVVVLQGLGSLRFVLLRVAYLPAISCHGGGYDCGGLDHMGYLHTNRLPYRFKNFRIADIGCLRRVRSQTASQPEPHTPKP